MAFKKRSAKDKKKVGKKRPMKRRLAAASRRKKTVKRAKPVKRKKPVGRPSTPPSKVSFSKKISPLKQIGRVTHFYREIKVAIVKFSQPVHQGTPVRFRGSTTDFAQKLDSMQHNHAAIAKAPKGKQIGVKVKSRVREGDQVYPA